MNLEQAVKDLQNNLIVIAEIERRQSALIEQHSERIATTEENLARSAKLNLEIQEIQKRTDLKLEELTDKLNGLIGYIEGQHKPPQ
jgi:hypothetical protein